MFNGKMNEVDEESKQVLYRVVRDENGVKLECPAISKLFTVNSLLLRDFFSASLSPVKDAGLTLKVDLVKATTRISATTLSPVRWLCDNQSEISEAQKSLASNSKMKHDILSGFIEISDDPDRKSTEKSLRHIVPNFVIAGRDTTSTTLTWAIYMIMMHEPVAEKLFLELQELERERAEETNASMHHYDT